MSAKIVYCRCAYAQVVPEAVKDEVLQGLCASGVSFECVSDLCELSARKDERVRRLFGEGDIRVAACHPRAVRWLLHSAGVDVREAPERIQVGNMREEPAESILASLLEDESS